MKFLHRDDYVTNAADFTRQYKMRLEKVADMFFGKESKKIRRKKVISNANYKKTEKHEYLILSVCFLHSIGK